MALNPCSEVYRLWLCRARGAGNDIAALLDVFLLCRSRPANPTWCWRNHQGVRDQLTADRLIGTTTCPRRCRWSSRWPNWLRRKRGWPMLTERYPVTMGLPNVTYSRYPVRTGRQRPQPAGGDE